MCSLILFFIHFEMLPQLPIVAEFSKVVSVVIILLVLILMMTYLTRVSVFPDFSPGNSSSVTWVHGRGVSQQPMLLTPNPFQLHLDPSSQSCSPTSATLELKAWSSVPCHCICWWGVDLRGLHALLAWPWPVFREVLLSHDQQRTPGICISSQSKQFESSWDLHLLIPEILQDGNSLGPTPRHRCPLVVFLLIAEEGADPNAPDNPDSSSNVVALASVVHVRDSIVPMDTGILTQFLKQANGQVTTLQPLYVSGVTKHDDENEAEQLEQELPESETYCIVCHSNFASLALLPCRHTCLCPHCLPRLKDCPLCRTHIQSYFYVIPPSGKTMESDTPEVTTRLRNVTAPSQ